MPLFCTHKHLNWNWTKTELVLNELKFLQLNSEVESNLKCDSFVQVEDTFQEGQDKKEEEQDKRDIKEEDNAIEMSEDFDGKMHDGSDHEPGDWAYCWIRW